MKAFSKSRGWFFEVDFSGQTICSLLKLAYALLAFGLVAMAVTVTHFHRQPPPWLSPAVLRVHGKNHARYKDAYFEQLTLRFRQNVFQELHRAGVHSSLLSSALVWAPLWVFLTRGHLPIQASHARQALFI